MTRRELVRLMAAAAAGSLPARFAGGSIRQLREPLVSTAVYSVGLVGCADYDQARLLEALRSGWKMTRPPDVRGKRIVIKPNIADFIPDRPIHTDPRLVEALVVHLRELGAGSVVLAEGPPHNRDTELIFRQTGFEALARRLGLDLVDLNYDSVRRVRNANPRARLPELWLPETVLSADVLISVPKLKTHRLAGVTLSLKNMFGLFPGLVYGWPKNILHWTGIPSSVCEINATVKTHFSVVDGIVGMEGYGPLLGSPKKAGVLVMGDNALAVDATAARVMGVDPGRVEHLALAQQLKLGSLRPRDIALGGGPIERLRTDFALDPEYAFLRASKGPLS